MRWSKYLMHVAKAEGARYITTSSGKDFPWVTVCGNHWNTLVMHKTLSLTTIAYILWPKEHPKTLKRRAWRMEEKHLPSPHYVMIQMLRVIGLVPPQYVFLFWYFHVFPLFPLRWVYHLSYLIYDNTLLDPFWLCLLVSHLVFLTLVLP